MKTVVPTTTMMATTAGIGFDIAGSRAQTWELIPSRIAYHYHKPNTFVVPSRTMTKTTTTVATFWGRKVVEGGSKVVGRRCIGLFVACQCFDRWIDVVLIGGLSLFRPLNWLFKSPGKRRSQCPIR